MKYFILLTALLFSLNARAGHEVCINETNTCHFIAVNPTLKQTEVFTVETADKPGISAAANKLAKEHGLDTYIEFIKLTPEQADRIRSDPTNTFTQTSIEELNKSLDMTNTEAYQVDACIVGVAACAAGGTIAFGTAGAGIAAAVFGCAAGVISCEVAFDGVNQHADRFFASMAVLDAVKTIQRQKVMAEHGTAGHAGGTGDPVGPHSPGLPAAGTGGLNCNTIRGGSIHDGETTWEVPPMVVCLPGPK